MPSATASPTISIVSPVYGCCDCLEDLIDRIEAALSPLDETIEIILVDDASPDDAWRRIQELAATRPSVQGLRLARNFGQHYAIAAGIETARGEWVVVMDCDLQDVPEEIPKLLAARSGDAEIVFAQRVERQDGPFKRLGSWAFFRLLSWMTGVPQDHTTANFGVYSRKVIDVINAMPERERCFPLMVKWTGFASTSIPVAHATRSKGRSSYSFKRLRQLATGIILSYSDKPLRFVVRVGLAFSAIAFGMVFLSVFRYLHGDIEVAGFTSLVASIWLVGGMSIFCIGVIGLYLGRMFVDAKSRPYYLIGQRTESIANNPEGDSH